MNNIKFNLHIALKSIKNNIFIVFSILLPSYSLSAPNHDKAFHEIEMEKNKLKSKNLMESYIKKYYPEIPTIPNISSKSTTWGYIKKEDKEKKVFKKDMANKLVPLFKLDDIALLFSSSANTNFRCDDNTGSLLSGILRNGNAFFVKDINTHDQLYCMGCSSSADDTPLNRLTVLIGSGHLTSSWHELMYAINDQDVAYLYEETSWTAEEKTLIEKALHIPPASKLDYYRSSIHGNQGEDKDEPDQPPSTTTDITQQLFNEQKEENQEESSDKRESVDCIHLMRTFLSIAITLRPPANDDDSWKLLEPLITHYKKPTKITDSRKNLPPPRERSKTQ